MVRKRYGGEEIAAILEEHEQGLSMQDALQKYGITKATFTRWRKKAWNKKIESLLQKNCWNEAIDIAKQLSQKDLVSELQFWYKNGAEIRSSHELSSSKIQLSNYGDFVLFVSGDIHYPETLYLDTYADNEAYIEGHYPIYIDGNLTVDGGIENLCPNTGTWLVVNGGITAHYLFGGGSLIQACSPSEFKYAVIGYYNDGAIYFNGVRCPLYWSEDHLMEVVGDDYGSYENLTDFLKANNKTHFDLYDDTETILELIRPEIRDEIIEDLHEYEAEAIEEEGEAYINRAPIFENYLLHYLFDDNGKQQFEYVFSGLFEQYGLLN